MVRARRPKAAQLTYNQGDGLFRFEVLKQAELNAEALLVTLRENVIGGKQVSVKLDEYELTVMIQKLFECLLNLQARRQP